MQGTPWLYAKNVAGIFLLTSLLAHKLDFATGQGSDKDKSRSDKDRSQQTPRQTPQRHQDDSAYQSALYQSGSPSFFNSPQDPSRTSRGQEPPRTPGSPSSPGGSSNRRRIQERELIPEEDYEEDANDKKITDNDWYTWTKNWKDNVRILS